MVLCRTAHVSLCFDANITGQSSANTGSNGHSHVVIQKIPQIPNFGSATAGKLNAAVRIAPSKTTKTIFVSVWVGWGGGGPAIIIVTIRYGDVPEVLGGGFWRPSNSTLSVPPNPPAL
jgi:hypothetical protein